MSMKSLKYRTLFIRHKEHVYSYAYSFLKNEMDAEDIAQEVWIRVWDNLELFDWSKAKGWILRTTHNLAIDFLRSKKRKDAFVNITEAETVPDFRYETKPDKLSENSSLSISIENAISLLPDKLKSVFVLYEIEKYKYKEIAEILEMPINSVKVNLMRARKELQKILSPLEEERYE